MKVFRCGGLCLAFLCLSVPAQAIEKQSPDGLWTYDDAVTIPVSRNPEDAAETRVMDLPANVFVPTGIGDGETRPAIVFVNSWTLNEYEYADQAEAFADDGYVVLSYTTRGFRGAPGYIDTAGNKDIADAAAAIDWLVSHYPVDPDRVGMAGVSYGAGISLLSAMRTDKVAAVVSMSGWANLVEALWAGQTPEQSWVQILISSSQWPLGRRDPEVMANLDNMRYHRNVQSTIDWGLERSAIHYVEAANALPRKPALYLSNNLHDYLFQPDTVIDFLGRYEGPWRVDFNRGTHASAEAGGLTRKETSSYQWRNAHLWFDHYLKGEANGIDALKPVNSVVLASEGEPRESHDGFPVHDSVRRFHARPPVGDTDGVLADAPSGETADVTLDAGRDAVWTGGVLGSLDMEARRYKLSDIDRAGALVFASPVLGQTLYLRGASTVTFSAEVRHNTQFFGYLLDLDPATGEAGWIGHGPLTWHRPEGDTTDPEGLVELTLKTFWTTHDIVAGHQLVLVLDLRDPDYWRFRDAPATTRIVIDADHPLTLEVPQIAARRTFTDIVEPAEPEDPGKSNDTEAVQYQPTGGAIPGLFLLPLVFWRRRFSRVVP